MLFAPDTNCILPLTFDPSGKVARFVDDALAHHHGFVLVPTVHSEAFQTVPDGHLLKAANALFHLVRQAAPVDQGTALALVKAFRAKYDDPFHPEGPWGRRLGDEAIRLVESGRVRADGLKAWARSGTAGMLPTVVAELKKPCLNRMFVCEFGPEDLPALRDRNLALAPFFDEKSVADRAVFAEVSILADRAGVPVHFLCGDKKFRASATNAIAGLGLRNLPPPIHAGPNVCPDFAHGTCHPRFEPLEVPKMGPVK